MKKEIKPLVSIKCLVYNHEPFLRQCLDGFIMQKTNFAFEAIVHDDASTDNSVAIIREYAEKYPDIIKPIYETENQYSKRDGSLNKIMTEAIHPDSKYVAYCEGDDYWTDPYKLQVQVDFLEKNKQCTLVYHACENYFDNFDFHIRIGESVKETYQTFELFSYPFQTATVIINKMVLFSDIYKKLNSTGCLAGDTLIFLSASLLGELHGMNKKMSVYRRHKNGISVNMEGPNLIYSNYISWVKVSKILKGNNQLFLEKNKLKYYFYNAYIKKDILLFIKLFLYGICNSPNSLKYGLELVFSDIIKRFKAILNVNKI